MRRSYSLLAALATLLAVLAFPLASPSQTTNTWSGTWSTTYGTTILEQKGSAVEGKYALEEGHVAGTVTGNVLNGKWDEAPRATAHDRGPFSFTMQPDGKSFIGTWGHDDTGPYPDPWNGTCTGGGCLQNGSTLAATLGSITRKVEVQRGEGSWERATNGMQLKKGDKIHTGFKAGVTLTFPDGSTVRMRPMTFILIRELSRTGEGLKKELVLKAGEIKASVQRLPGTHGDFEVKTPTTTTSWRGTKASVLYDQTATFVAVTQGSVAVRANSGRQVIVPAGKEARSTARSVSRPVKIGRGAKRGGLTAAKAAKRLAAKVTKGLKACKFDVVSLRVAPAGGGWRGSFVIVGAGQGIDDQPVGTAKFRLKRKRVGAANALARRIIRRCR